MTTKKLGQSARASHAGTAQVRAVIAARKAKEKGLVTKQTIALDPEDITQEAFQRIAADPTTFKVLWRLLAGFVHGEEGAEGAHLTKDRGTVKSAAAAISTDPHACWEMLKGRAPFRFANCEVDLRQAADRLAEMDLHLSATAVTSSQAKDQWPAIARDAEQGVLTPIERRGGATLVVVPAEKLAHMAAQVPSKITFGDLLRNHPGVKATAVPRPRSSAGPVTRLRLPAGKPSVNS